MNKAVIIGIAIAIIVGIIGIYAVSTQGGPIKELGLDIGDQVGITVEEPKDTAQEETFGIKDDAGFKIEEPGEEEPERIFVHANETFQLGDKQK